MFKEFAVNPILIIHVCIPKVQFQLCHSYHPNPCCSLGLPGLLIEVNLLFKLEKNLFQFSFVQSRVMRISFHLDSFCLYVLFTLEGFSQPFIVTDRS